jgi:putative oxidoreductase
MVTRLMKPDLAALILRLGLAIVLLVRGLLKVAVSSTEWDPNLPAWIQAVVAWVEVLAAVAILLGFFTRVAVVPVIVIQLGAIFLVTGALGFMNIQYGTGQAGFNTITPGFEYNITIIVMSLALLVLGSGAPSLDQYLFGRRKALAPAEATPARTETPAVPS